MLNETPTCQNGHVSRDEYRAGIRRERCANPATIAVERETDAGTTYATHVCDDHAPAATDGAA